MILKKPYAFIIKHFKLIHLIILGCIVFSVYTLSGISSLATTLLSSRTYTYTGADVYINSVIYLFILIALFLSVVLYILLKKKDKPIGLYFGLICYNIVSFIAYIYLFSVLRKLTNSTVEIDTIRFVRDLIIIMDIASVVFIAICLVRGIGFNIKQFNFSKDIAELNIADKDSEEFELMVGQNNYKYLRFIRRTIRETKYYILENMVAITFIAIGLGAILLFLGVKYYKRYVAKIKAQQVTQVNGINYVLNKAYITAEDYNGERIKDGSKFVVLDMSFENVSNNDATVDLDKISLINKQLKYKPTLTYNYKFYDLGNPYEKNTPIATGEMSNKYIVFEIPDSTTTTKYTLRIEYGVYSKNSKVLDNFVQFDIDAKNIDGEDKRDYLKLNDQLYTNVNGENEFKLTVKDYKLLENFSYKYVICNKALSCSKYDRVISANMHNQETMLVIDYDASIFEDAKFTKKFNNMSKILTSFAYVEYDTANRKYTEKATMMTGTDGVSNKSFILVNNRIKQAKRIYLYFKFRNHLYTISLKE